MLNPTAIYYGEREAIIAEIGEHKAIYGGKYLVCPVGCGEFDAEGVGSKKALKELLAYYRENYPAIPFYQV